MAMRGNQETTQEIPQSSFAMTILPGAGSTRTRPVRAPKEPRPPKEARAPKEPRPPKEARAPKEPRPAKEARPPKEARGPRFTVRAHKETPAVETVPLIESTPPPVQFDAPPPPPLQFNPPPPPPQFSPPPAPAQFDVPPPPPLQFAPLYTADRFAAEASAPEAPALETPEPEALALEYPAPDYPVTFPTSPGYPPQPHYAEHPDPAVFPAAPEVPWVPQHAAPAASGSGRGSALSSFVGVIAGLRQKLNSVGHRDRDSVDHEG
jgi:hypothetical protein